MYFEKAALIYIFKFTVSVFGIALLLALICATIIVEILS